MGRWIASVLPYDPGGLYVEPFAGMLGVLLQRPRAATELVNDLNGRVVNWWKCLRDEPEELLRRVELTPNARDEFVGALSRLDSGTSVDRAAAFTTVVMCSIRSSDNSGSSDWKRTFDRASRSGAATVERLERVAERIRDVQIENRDAVELLDRVRGYENAVVYVDPPYPSAAQNLYQNTRFDRWALTEVLSEQLGRVAISGYGDEWDRLDWERSSKVVQRMTPGTGAGEDRVEVLWTNFDPAQQLEIF